MSHEDVDERGWVFGKTMGNREPSHRHIKNKYSTDVGCTCVEDFKSPLLRWNF